MKEINFGIRFYENQRKGGLKMKSFLFLFLISLAVLAESQEKPQSTRLEDLKFVPLKVDTKQKQPAFPVMVPLADVFLEHYKNNIFLESSMLNCRASNQQDEVLFGLIFNAFNAEDWIKQLNSEGPITFWSEKACFHAGSDDFIEIQAGIQPNEAKVTLSLNVNGEKNPSVQTHDYLKRDGLKYLHISYGLGEVVYSAECLVSSAPNGLPHGTFSFNSSCDKIKEGQALIFKPFPKD